MNEEQAIRIVEWYVRYEVNSSGQSAKDGDTLRQSPLPYVRCPVFGRKQGAGYRMLCRIAGRKKVAEVFGIFIKLLEIAADNTPEKRGMICNAQGESASVEDLAFLLDMPPKQIVNALQVLSDKRLNWISVNGLPGIQVIQGIHGNPCSFKNISKGNINKDKENIYSPNSTEFGLSKFLLDCIKKRKPDFKEPNMQSWAKHIDQMIRLDHRDPAKIRAVIEWCQDDSFWQNNILSTEKLRKQFDRLEMQKNAKNPRATTTGQGDKPKQPFVR